MKDLTGQDNINKSILNSFGVSDEVEDTIEKSHKYLRKEGKRYIYDYDKMSSKDHKRAEEHHNTLYQRQTDKAFGSQLNEKEQDIMDYHFEERNKHRKLAKEKEKKDDIKKSHGEGSKGGKVIGHTKSGKPIYQNSKEAGVDHYTKQDHEDASEAHSEEMHKRNSHTSLKDGKKDPNGSREERSSERKHHREMRDFHYEASKTFDKK